MTDATRKNVLVAASSVVATLVASGLGVVLYAKLLGGAGAAPGDDRCACPQADESTPRRIENETASRALAALAAAKAAGQAPAVDRKVPATPSPTAPPPDEEDVPSNEEILARNKADAFALDVQLAGEEVDTPWATRVERATSEAIAALGDKVRLDGVACRETICRAHVTHLDPKAREETVDRLLSLPVVVSQALVFAPPDDPGATLLYFSRKGISLSVFQPPPEMFVPKFVEEASQAQP